MIPRSLHTSNDSSYQINRGNDELSMAKKRFSDNISNGISVLVRRHGYSRVRAAELILDQIRQSDALPTDDEVFRVMNHLGLGLEAGKQTVIVAKALKRVQRQGGHTESSAIDFLSSCLTTMKLLGSVEKTVTENHSQLDSPISASMPEKLLNSAPLPSSSSSSSTAKSSAVLNNRKTNNRRTASKNNKNNKARQSKPPKQQRKRSKDEENGNNVDVSCADKALLVKEQSHVDSAHSHQKNCMSPSPNVARHGAKRVSAHIDELNVQPATKRQRLDSI